MPLVSIIIPVYNTEKYLQECIESIVHQTFFDIEIILVDDGSEDGSYKLCEEYQKKDSRIVLLHQENRGVSAARNLGLQNAHGEFITFCDSDDYVMPNWIQELYRRITENEIDLSCCAFNRVPTGNNSSNIIKEGCYPKSDFWILLKAGLLNSVFTKMFRRRIIEENELKFDETKNNGEDILFVLSYIKSMRSGFYYSPNLNYNYRVTPNSLTNSYVENYFVNTVNRYIRIKEVYIECGGAWERIKKEYYALCQDAVYYALRNNFGNGKKTLPMQFAENYNIIRSDYCKMAFCEGKTDGSSFLYLYKASMLVVFQMRVLVYGFLKKNKSKFFNQSSERFN